MLLIGSQWHITIKWTLFFIGFVGVTLVHKIIQASSVQLNKTSGQDGGVGRYTLPPHTTKRRTTTNLKTKNNQNCQNNQGVKEETFIQTGRRGGDRQLGQRGCTARQQLKDEVAPHLCVITRKNNCRARQTEQPRVPALGNKASNLWLLKPVGLWQWEKLSASQESSLERITGS